MRVWLWRRYMAKKEVCSTAAGVLTSTKRSGKRPDNATNSVWSGSIKTPRKTHQNWRKVRICFERSDWEPRKSHEIFMKSPRNSTNTPLIPETVFFGWLLDSCAGSQDLVEFWPSKSCKGRKKHPFTKHLPNQAN